MYSIMLTAPVLSFVVIVQLSVDCAPLQKHNPPILIVFTRKKPPLSSLPTDSSLMSFYVPVGVNSSISVSSFVHNTAHSEHAGLHSCGSIVSAKLEKGTVPVSHFLQEPSC